MLKRNHIISIQKTKKSKNIKKIYAKFAEFAKKFLNSADNFVLFFVLYAENIDWRSSSFMKSKAVVLTSSLFSLCVAVFLLTACKDNVYTMLDDYNSHFIPKEDEFPDPKPGDSQFDSSRMLRDQYDIYDNETLNLYGPYGCSSYKWTIMNPFIREETDDEGNIVTYYPGKPVELSFYSNSYDSISQRFILVPSTSGLLLGVYILELSVTDKNNQVYTDSCRVNINRHID